MRVWLVRLRTALAALAAVFLLWQFPAVLEMLSAPRVGIGGEVKPMTVLRVWVCEDWTGTAMQWVSGQAAAFEKKHRDVRVIVRRAQRGDWHVTDSVPPDVLIFDAEAMGDPSAILLPLGGEYALRNAVQSAGDWRGVPFAVTLCYGGYVRIINEARPDGATLVMRSEAEYQEFAQQKAGTLIATVRAVRRLSALEAAGKGFPFRTEPHGTATDRLLLAGRFTAEGDRARLSETFIQFLLTQSAQDALPDLGLIPASMEASPLDETKHPLAFALQMQIIQSINAFDEHPDYGLQ